MLRKNLIIGMMFLFALSLVSNSLSAAGKKDLVDWETFKGAWFEVFYPSDFIVRTSLVSKNKPGQIDSVFFSPLNRSVEFYAFAPLYGYDPEDIQIKSNENLVSTSEKKKNSIITKTTILSDKEGKYNRTIIDVTNTGPRNTFARQIFGFKYVDQRTFDAFNKIFQKFVKSYVPVEK
ncbi:MAG: hypothetical protein HQM10_02365 [Candidatus Riflebacteria bacterium]|nr:hypothetical protein [Candidatus Riflebacteria bacterium]